MLNTFLALCNKFSLGHERLEIHEKPNIATSIIYRDELVRKKTSPNKTKKVRFSEPLVLKKEEEEVIKLCDRSGEEKVGIRIKVKMTKEEAARVLSKCKNGGVLEFKDLASELVQIPSNRVSVLPPSRDTSVMLKTIPEEA